MNEPPVISNKFTILNGPEIVVFEFYYVDPPAGSQARESQTYLVKKIALPRQGALQFVKLANDLLNQPPEPPSRFEL